MFQSFSLLPNSLPIMVDGGREGSELSFLFVDVLVNGRFCVHSFHIYLTLFRLLLNSMFRGLQAALRMLPVAAHAAPSPAEEPPDERTALHQTSPAHLLTVSEVFKTFPKVTSINTPDINSKLAIPFKKELVGTREPFKEIYSATRANIKSVSGKLTNYQEEKERRRSLPFYWPESDGKI